MFICEPCAKKYYEIDPFWFIIGPFSRGPCESCNVVSTCLDVPSSSLKLKTEFNKGSGEPQFNLKPQFGHDIIKKPE